MTTYRFRPPYFKTKNDFFTLYFQIFSHKQIPKIVQLHIHSVTYTLRPNCTCLRLSKKITGHKQPSGTISTRAIYLLLQYEGGYWKSDLRGGVIKLQTKAKSRRQAKISRLWWAISSSSEVEMTSGLFYSRGMVILLLPWKNERTAISSHSAVQARVHKPPLRSLFQ